MILFKVTQNTPKWKYFIFLYRCYERSGCSGFTPRWSSEAPNKENGCCSWTCDSVAAVSVCTVYETVVTELLVMRTLRVPTFARFLRGQAGLWRKVPNSGIVNSIRVIIHEEERSNRGQRAHWHRHKIWSGRRSCVVVGIVGYQGLRDIVTVKMMYNIRNTLPAKY